MRLLGLVLKVERAPVVPPPVVINPDVFTKNRRES